MDAVMSPPEPFNEEFPTPPASSVAPSTHPNPLPKPRKHPLRPGSTKEAELISFLARGLGHVQVRVNNRVNKRRVTELMESEEKGYRTFAEAAKELEPLVDVIWVSGSPNLQIPNFLNVARMVIDSLPLFSPAPRSTFRLLEKLDFAFSSLLQTRDPDTNEPLPGFENGRTVSTTDKVRIKGIVERTRLVVVKVFGGEMEDQDTDIDMNSDSEGDDDEKDDMSRDGDVVHFEGFEDNDEDERNERRVAEVYERTLGELGDLLGGPPIGIITDD